MASRIDAIRASLPPKADHLTFLTILSYNLSPTILPDLHDILQDPELTTQIGWDLIPTLIPLLPESRQCLRDVALLGNPRECVLKATESLRELQFDPEAPDDESEDELREKPRASDYRADKIETSSAKPSPLFVFTTLLSLLATLQPRIKTARPSRFLSSTLRAVLSTYNDATRHLSSADVDELTSGVSRFVKSISGKKRPHLPPRRSTQEASLPKDPEAAPDPEASGAPSSGELALQKRLLQAFVTHLVEDAVQSHPLEWSVRFDEKFRPEKIVRGRPSVNDTFAKDSVLHARDSIIGQLLALAQDLDLPNLELLKTLTQPESEPNEDEEPSKPEDIPLSRVGALFLLTARCASPILFGSPASSPDFKICPDHVSITASFLAAESETGAATDSVLDAVIALGLYAYSRDSIGSTPDDELFHNYLQTLSLISATNPSPTLRYAAHLLCSTALHAHPVDTTHLNFIRDTLEHCPFENLKGSAVGWLKDEIISANTSSDGARQKGDEDEETFFSSPTPLRILFPLLFPSLTPVLLTPPLSTSYQTLKASLTFYLSVLNFYRFLLLSTHLHDKLDIPSLHGDHDIEGNFLSPVRDATKRFREGLGEGGELRDEEGEEGVKVALAELDLLDHAVGQVEDAVKELRHRSSG
ncbi:MAG: hypothetical protein M1817_003561 [Caeruleum heppii]|nr:MAG: hypothetical protein M1817_003561 [Caeruleum heppii]